MPDNLPARQTRVPARQSPYTNPPRTEYVYVQDRPGGSRIRDNWAARTLATRSVHVSVPQGVPRMLGNASVLGYTWVGAMIVVGFDEWKNKGILPRPARLWYTSLVYGILALLTIIPVMVPLANALGIGFLIVLIWQYFNKEGQFSE